MTLDFVRHLRINISEKNTQRFDDSMSSFSSEKRIKINSYFIPYEGDKRKKLKISFKNLNT